MLSEIDFTQHPLKNPLKISSFVGKSIRRQNVFLISRILLQFEESDTVINSSMQQPRKLIPVIYSATYFEPALLVGGLVCFFITRFWKVFVKNQKPWQSTRGLLNECHCKSMWKKKTFNKNLSRNNNFQIMRESLQLICQFLTDLSGALLL